MSIWGWSLTLSVLGAVTSSVIPQAQIRPQTARTELAKGLLGVSSAAGRGPPLGWPG